jgi:hypothetical protein
MGPFGRVAERGTQPPSGRAGRIAAVSIANLVDERRNKTQPPRNQQQDRVYSVRCNPASDLVAGGRFAFTATAHLDLCFVVVV